MHSSPSPFFSWSNKFPAYIFFLYEYPVSPYKNNTGCKCRFLLTLTCGESLARKNLFQAVGELDNPSAWNNYPCFLRERSFNLCQHLAFQNSKLTLRDLGWVSTLWLGKQLAPQNLYQSMHRVRYKQNVEFKHLLGMVSEGFALYRDHQTEDDYCSQLITHPHQLHQHLPTEPHVLALSPARDTSTFILHTHISKNIHKHKLWHESSSILQKNAWHQHQNLSAECLPSWSQTKWERCRPDDVLLA